MNETPDSPIPSGSTPAPPEFVAPVHRGVAILVAGIAGVLLGAVGIGSYAALWAQTSHAPSTMLVATSTAVLVVSGFTLFGIKIVHPAEAAVFTFLGTYRGSVTDPGTWWVNPLWRRAYVSLRLQNFTSDTLKVNDADGNPVMVAATVAWRVTDTAKAEFGVEVLDHFVIVQASAALREVVHGFTYDRFDTDATTARPTLVHDGNLVSRVLRTTLTERLAIAGVEVVDTRIADLSYAPEIAEAMLRRQQASAIVAARVTIVNGAVATVKHALADLECDNLNFHPEARAAFASNLMTVLVGDHGATPVLNVGTLTQ